MNNLLIPRNIDGRKEKLRKLNIQLLSQEVIEGDLRIDESFKNIPLELIKVKHIKGNCELYNYTCIPIWLKNVHINRNLRLIGHKYISIANCPKFIGNNLYLLDNYKLLDLPEEVEIKGKIISKCIVNWKRI